MSDLLTTDDVAELARTTPATVRWWRHVGRGPQGFRVGRRILYRRTVVEAWLRELESAETGGSAA